MDWRVIWSKRVDKQLARIPVYLTNKFFAWSMVVERIGLLEARKMAGYHDEPLQGQRKGQRPIRLNRDYRAIYIEHRDHALGTIEVLEISKHEY